MNGPLYLDFLTDVAADITKMANRSEMGLDHVLALEERCLSKVPNTLGIE